ncbi:FAD/NAD(P)-binding protein [Streptomyces venezuelae]|uniref:FAD/NAD(P)-binding protein n=1 Tax=Streptomyces venezuelae TaxID=54571 RepID=UPI003F54227B
MAPGPPRYAPAVRGLDVTATPLPPARSGAAHKTVCVVGAGPRGLSVLERLLARERHDPAHGSLTVHLVDPGEPGAGAVWRTDQPPQLLMNTVASQITLYTDDSCDVRGPVEPGPSLYEWAVRVAAGDGTDLDDATRAAAGALGPDTYPTRALYGRYLRAAFRRVVDRAPGHVAVEVHRTRAVALLDTGEAQSVCLEDGTWLGGLDAVVLAQGHTPVRPLARELRTTYLARRHGLTHLLPANPADVDLASVRPGDEVLLRGLGLCFFDYLALLTTGRGGVFVQDRERLVYRPSGREPRMYATSRRGIPYHARGENQKGVSERHRPRLLTPEVIAGFRERARLGQRVRFGEELWPLVAAEVESVYYATLLRESGRGGEEAAFVDRYVAAAGPGERDALLDAVGVRERLRWDELAQPYRDREFGGRADFGAWARAHLVRDVAEARKGNRHGPLKAALDVLRDLRNEVRLVVDHAGLDGASHRHELSEWYTPFNGFLSIGPPVSRIEELIALLDAGVVELLGPGTEIRIETSGREAAFTARSARVPGPPVRARVLIEARLQEPDLRRSADPLLSYLLGSGQAAPFRIPEEGGGHHETGGLAVTERPYHLVDAEGRAHPRRFAYGVPTEGVHWVTAAGIRPGVDSVTLADSDAIAAALHALPALVAPGADDVHEPIGVLA